MFLGAHTLSLREDLEKTEKKGEDDIKSSTKTLQDSIDKQMAGLKLANSEIQDKTRDFEQRLTNGKDRIDKAINDFTSKSDEIKKQIADIVVQRLDSELKKPLSEVSAQIAQRGNAALSQIDGAKSSALDPLMTRGKEITEKLDQLRDTITKADSELRTQAPALERLKGVGARLDELGDKLNKIEAKENALTNSVSRAGTQADLASSHAEAAKQAAELASQARTKVVSDVQAISNGAAEQERIVGSVSARIDNLKKQIDGLETQLKTGLPVKLDSAALTVVMNPLTARIGKVEDRLDHQPPAPALPDITGLTARVSRIEDRLDRVPPASGPPDLGPLTARVAKVEDRLDHPPPGPPSTELAGLAARVAKLEDRLDHQGPPQPAPSFPTTEAALTLDQKMQIQKALNFSGRQVDGEFGPNTRRAIAAFRQSKHVTTSGDLTADEIKELLSRTR